MSLEPNLLCGSVRTRWRLLLTSNSYILLTSHGLTAPFCTTYREIVQKVCFGNPTTNKNVVTIYVNEMGERIQKWISIKLWLNTPMKKKHEEAKDWKYQKKKQSSWKTALTSCSSCSTPFEDASQTTLPVFSSLSFNLFISYGQGGGHEEEEEVVVMVVVVAERGKLVVVIMLTTMIHRIKWIKNLKGANL